MASSEVVATVVAFGVSAASAPIVWRSVRFFGLMDHPTARSSHKTSTPRGGGVSVLLGTLVGALAGLRSADRNSVIIVALLAVAIVGGVGLWDDVKSLPAVPRLATQTIASVALVIVSGLGSQGLDLYWATPTAVFFIVGFINAFNFMDGINGISSLTAVVIGISIGSVGLATTTSPVVVLPLAAAGAAAGFLPFNFPNAKMFLGDVGSYALGATLAISAVLLIDAGAPVIAILPPFGLYAADVTWTLLSRVRRGEPLFEPHRNHAYQKLADHHWGQTRTTVLVALLTTVLAVLAVLIAQISTVVIQVGLLMLASLLAASYVALPSSARLRAIGEPIFLPHQSENE